MKFPRLCLSYDCAIVAPHAGAWIEMETMLDMKKFKRVAPHAGAWIEILLFNTIVDFEPVAPHAGAWIEIL